MGTIHDDNGRNKSSYNGATPTSYLNRSFGLHPAFAADVPRVECGHTTPVNMTAFLDNLSPASLVSPGTDCSRSSRESRSPSTALLRRSDVSSSLGDRSVSKDEMSETGSDDTSPDEKNNESGRHSSSLGFYRENSKTDSERSAHVRDRCRSRSRSTDARSNDNASSTACLKEKERDTSESSDTDKGNTGTRASRVTNNKQGDMDTTDESIRDEAHEISGNHLKTSTPCSDKDRSCDTNGSNDVMDLSKGPNYVMDLSNGPNTLRQSSEDLALSPPHSYTAQVSDFFCSFNSFHTSDDRCKYIKSF